jgi:hypothetical protein
MNLVVASRHDAMHMRFDVEGRWRSGDALKLAYMVKAAVARLRLGTPPDAEGKFLICDRLRRALTPSTKVVLVAMPDLVDTDGVPTGQAYCPDIALFNAERDALDWLSLK